MAELIQKTDSLDNGRVKLNEAIKQSERSETKSDEALSMANTAKQSADSTRTELDAVVNRETDSDAMSRQAAVDENGVDHGNLKTRLDDSFNSVNQDLAQIDNVKIDKTTAEEKLNLKRDKNIKLNKTDYDLSLDSNKWDVNDWNERTRQTFLEAQGINVNQIIGKNNIVYENVTPGAITQEKTNFIEIVSNNLFDKNSVLYNTGIDSNTGKPIPLANNALQPFREVKPNTPYTFYGPSRWAFYTDTYELISTDSLGENPVIKTVETPSNCRYMMLTVFTGANDDRVGWTRFNEGTELLSYDEFKVKMKNIKVDSDELGDKAANSVKRTVLGSMASFTFGTPYKKQNINMTNKTLEFFGQTMVMWNNKRYRLSINSGDITKVDFSQVWNNGALIPLIYFNTVTNQFEVYASTDYANINEDSVLVAILHKNDKRELIGVTMNGDYTVNELHPNQYFGVNESSHYIPMEVPEGWYIPSEVEGFTNRENEITLDLVYNEFEDWITNNPSYITKSEFGLDTTDTYPVYKYILDPPDMVTSPNKSLPKIIIVSGTHGEEKAAVLSLMYFLRDVVNNWQNNPILEYIRWNVKLVVVPILNPYGFVHNQRKNGNNVDINRNGEYRFYDGGSTDPSSWEYKGPYPYSEKETQYARDLILDNLDAICFYDYHMVGTGGDAYGTLFMHEIEPTSKFNMFHELAKHDLKKLSIEGRKRYGITYDGIIGGITVAKNGTLGAQATHLGVMGSSLECTRKLVEESVYYSSKVLKMDTEHVGNRLIGTLRVFNKYMM